MAVLGAKPVRAAVLPPKLGAAVFTGELGGGVVLTRGASPVRALAVVRAVFLASRPALEWLAAARAFALACQSSAVQADVRLFRVFFVASPAHLVALAASRGLAMVSGLFSVPAPVYLAAALSVHGVVCACCVGIQPLGYFDVAQAFGAQLLC
jgi:hypothetical protein